MKIKIFLFLVLILSCYSKNEQKNDLKKENLYGDVKSFYAFSFVAFDKFGEISKGDRTGETHVEYNYKGNRIEFSKYKSDGSLSFKETRKYDDKDNIIEENNYEPDGSLYSKKIYKYYPKGNIKINYYENDGSLYVIITYKYDDKGNIIEENNYEPDGSLSNKTTYKYDYDDKNNWTKRIEFYNDIPTEVWELEIEYYE